MKKLYYLQNLIVRNDIEIITEENALVHVSDTLIEMILKTCTTG